MVILRMVFVLVCLFLMALQNVDGSSTEYCSVCLESKDVSLAVWLRNYCVDHRRQLYTFPVCKHVFHLDCASRWIVENASCPECRAEINDDVSVDLQQRLQKIPKTQLIFLATKSVMTPWFLAIRLFVTSIKNKLFTKVNNIKTRLFNWYISTYIYIPAESVRKWLVNNAGAKTVPFYKYRVLDSFEVLVPVCAEKIVVGFRAATLEADDIVYSTRTFSGKHQKKSGIGSVYKECPGMTPHLLCLMKLQKGSAHLVKIEGRAKVLTCVSKWIIYHRFLITLFSRWEGYLLWFFVVMVATLGFEDISIPKIYVWIPAVLLPKIYERVSDSEGYSNLEIIWNICTSFFMQSELHFLLFTGGLFFIPIPNLILILLYLTLVLMMPKLYAWYVFTGDWSWDHHDRIIHGTSKAIFRKYDTQNLNEDPDIKSAIRLLK